MLKQFLTLIFCINAVLLLQANSIKADVSGNVFVKDPKIINGSDASLGEVKYQVSIRRRLTDSLSFGDGHTCGGSLISENVVLSAAHCFTSYSGSFISAADFTVVMGTLNRTQYTNYTLVFDISTVVIYGEKFNKITLEDDIALVILKGKVPADHCAIKPIILNEGPIKNNTMCRVSGWGLNEDNVRSEILKVVDQPYIDFDDCREKTRYGFSVRRGMLCAGFLSGGRGPCTADSGGPLVCQGIQAGIVSWSGGCAMPLNPAVYADVAFYKNWILKQVANNNGTLPAFSTIPNGAGHFSCSLFLVTLLLILNIISKDLN